MVSKATALLIKKTEFEDKFNHFRSLHMGHAWDAIKYPEDKQIEDSSYEEAYDLKDVWMWIVENFTPKK